MLTTSMSRHSHPTLWKMREMPSDLVVGPEKRWRARGFRRPAGKGALAEGVLCPVSAGLGTVQAEGAGVGALLRGSAAAEGGAFCATRMSGVMEPPFSRGTDGSPSCHLPLPLLLGQADAK